MAIFRYLRDLAHLRTAVTRDLRSYERCFWLDAVRSRPGCTSRCFRPDDQGNWLSGDTVEDDLWLTVRKMPEPNLPPLSATIRSWVEPQSGRSPDVPPRLRDRIPREAPAPKRGRAAMPSELGANGQESSGGADTARPTVNDQYELLEDHPEIAVALNDYMQAAWNPWAEKYAAWLEFQEKVYSPLFVIHRDLKRLGEEFELVLGIGCLDRKSVV